jgi:hypothetical protein
MLPTICNATLLYDNGILYCKLQPKSVIMKIISGSTGFCGHVFSGAYKLKNDPGSGSGKSFEDISVIPEPENS